MELKSVPLELREPGSCKLLYGTPGVWIGPRDGGGEGVWEPGWVGPPHPERLCLFLLLNCSRNCAFIKCDSHPSPAAVITCSLLAETQRTGMAALLGAGFPTRKRADFILVEFVRYKLSVRP